MTDELILPYSPSGCNHFPIFPHRLPGVIPLNRVDFTNGMKIEKPIDAE